MVRTGPKTEDWRRIFNKFLEDLLKDSYDMANYDHRFRANVAENCRRILDQIKGEKRKERKEKRGRS